MPVIFGALAPVFALVALGHLAARSGYLGAGMHDALTRFVALVSLPVLTFRAIATMPVRDLANPVMLAVVVGASALVGAAGLFLVRVRGASAAEANLRSLSASYGNSAFVGLPVCLAAFGPACLGPGAVVMALNTLFVFGGGVFVAVLAGRGPHGPRTAVRAVLRQLGTNPLVIAALAGVGLAVLTATTGLRLPGPVDATLALLGGVTGPCALFAIGLFTAQPLHGRIGWGVWGALAGKLVAMPLVTLALLALLPSLDPVWRATALVMASVPCATSIFVLAQGAGGRALHEAAAAIVLPTLGAEISLPVLVALAGW